MEYIINETLAKGVELHLAGELDLASKLYGSVIKLQPKHADANHNMGLLKLDKGHDLDALPYLQMALQADTSIARFWLSYINALIKLERRDEAARIISLAKENGMEGEEFLVLSQKLSAQDEVPTVIERQADTANKSKSNILDKLKLDKALNLAKTKTKTGSSKEAKLIYQDILEKFPKNKKAQQGLIASKTQQTHNRIQSPSQEIINQLMHFYNKGDLVSVVEKAQTLIKQYPDAFMIWNILGAANRGLGKLDEALKAFQKVTKLNPRYVDGIVNFAVILKEKGNLDEAIENYKRVLVLKPNYVEVYLDLGIALEQKNLTKEAIQAYRKAIKLKPNYAEAYNNMGNALSNGERLKEAIEAYTKAIELKSNYAEAYNNIGNALRTMDQCEEAIKFYCKAININPKLPEAHNNLGIIFKSQGKLDAAIAAHKKAIFLKPDYSDAYNNMGNALQDLGKLNEAMKAFNEALSLKSNSAEVHRNLSALIKYKADDPQVCMVAQLIKKGLCSDKDLCQLHYAYAKMQEDLGELPSALSHYVSGGLLRQNILRYNISKDIIKFEELKTTAPKITAFPLSHFNEPSGCKPIFIIGMPRSGTTLVEQIISCHSKVQDAGELKFLGHFSSALCRGHKTISSESILQIRETYLNELSKVSQGKPFVTDKLPHNFLYVGIILKALPEAKIIHVRRDAAATCWSNFRQYFSDSGLGYSYSLLDTIRYFEMYKDLMEFWEDLYPERVYHLNYEQLTVAQDEETRRLIKHLSLEWEDAFLSPENNKRIVRTASQQQVRKKIYKGSSDTWRKFAPYLNGAFDGLQ
jgi:tetratricopeptide (TPR) repeat protein